MGSPPTLEPVPTRPPDTGHQQHHDTRDGRDELLEHLQTPAAWGGHEFGDWPVDQIANGFGGDLDARHRHDHTRLILQPHLLFVSLIVCATGAGLMTAPPS